MPSEEKANPISLRKSLSEADEIRRYIQTKPLARPKTNAMTICIIVLSFVISTLLEAYGMICLFHLQAFMLPIIIVFYIVNFVLWLKYIAIKLVECYQHYAKEEIRRRCLCKPTCSEYAICVLNQYFVFVALYKIYKRLFKTCKNDYKIDLP